MSHQYLSKNSFWWYQVTSPRLSIAAGEPRLTRRAAIKIPKSLVNESSISAVVRYVRLAKVSRMVLLARGDAVESLMFTKLGGTGAKFRKNWVM